MSAGAVVGWALFTAFVVSVFVFTFLGQTLYDHWWRRRAAQTPEQVWREMMAARIWSIPALLVFAACVTGIETRTSWLPYLWAAVVCGRAIVLTWNVVRDVRGGWRNVQDTKLARRAHELVREARERAARFDASGGEYR